MDLPFALRSVAQRLSRAMKEGPLVTGQRGGKFHHCSGIGVDGEGQNQQNNQAFQGKTLPQAEDGPFWSL